MNEETLHDVKPSFHFFGQSLDANDSFTNEESPSSASSASSQENEENGENGDNDETENGVKQGIHLELSPSVNVEEETTQTIETLSFSHQLFQQNQRRNVNYSDLKNFCYLDGDEGTPILKFSRIFSHSEQSFPSLKRKYSKPEEDEMEKEQTQIESDEEEILSKVERTDGMLAQNKIRKLNKDHKDGKIYHSMNCFPHSIKRTINDTPKRIQSESSFQPIEHQKWEESIIWENGEEEFSIEKPQYFPCQDLLGIEHKNHWGSLQEETFEAPPSPPKKKRALKDLNEELVYSADLIVGPIIWKTDEPNEDFPTKLVVDFNDDHIFPETINMIYEKRRKEFLLDCKRKKNSDLNEDRFNISNDGEYESTERTGVIKRTIGKTAIIHSDPALKLSLMKTALTDEDLKHFHRPTCRIQPAQTVKVNLSSTKKAPERKSMHDEVLPQMRHKSDLSVADGRFVLMEYVEEYPLVVMNHGMGSKIRIYYRKKNVNENPLLKFDDGERVLLEPTDKSPFLGDIEPGKTIQALDNNLFRSPIFRHAVPTTDFLLIRSGKNAEIREIPATYTVGQQQPLIEIPAPNSKAANIFTKNRLQVYINRLFLKDPHRKVKISGLMRLFPGNSETSIRRTLKDIADFQRAGDDSGYWTVKDQSLLRSEEDLRNIVTPEMISLHESMLFGLYRLKAVGISQFTTISPHFSSAMQQIKDSEDEYAKKICRNLENELLMTPWSLSNSFVNSMQGKGLLQLSGLGDPSGGRGEAFSYVKMPQKSSQPIEKKQNLVTGTDADLRSLSLADASRTLLNFGVSQAEIDKLSRWQKIALVRKKANDAKALGEGGETKYARNSRYSLNEQQQQYKDKIQFIFNNQVKALAEPNPEFSDDEDEDPIDSYASNLESMMIGAEKRKKQRTMEEAEMEDEKASFEALKRQNEEFLSHSLTSVEFQPPTTGRYIRKKRKVHHGDGSMTYDYDYITDPKEVEDFIQNIHLQRERKKQIEEKKLKSHLSPEEEERRKREKREKRKIQERKRRERKKKKDQEELRRKIESGETIITDLKYKCGACGMPGHMRTNRSCPLYKAKSSEVEEVEEEELESSASFSAKEEAISSSQ